MMLRHALVLTSPPTAPALTEDIARQAWELIPAAERRGCSWLSQNEAWQALFAAGDSAGATRIRSAVTAALAHLPADVNVVPDDEGRRKRLLVADMESTIIAQECLDELAESVGLRERIAAITERSMRGEVPFEAALAERVALLRGLDAGALEALYQRLTVTPGAEVLVATMRRHGAASALVSGGFTFFTARIAARLGFQVHQANTLEIVDGRLAGRVLPPVLGRAGKLDALLRLAADLGLSASETLAVGDGANDLDMIRAAGLGVAFRGKPLVREQAAALPNGAIVTHGDLTALLYLQGYRKDEFALAHP